MCEIKVLPFGGCRINSPFAYAATADRRLLPLRGQWVPAIYTFDEVSQLIDIWNGDVRIPEDIAPFISNWSDRLKEQPGFVDDADVVLVETSSETELSLDGIVVNRAAISDRILKPVKGIGKEAHQHVSKWYNTGIAGFNEEARELHSKKLVALIPDEFPDASLLRHIVLHLRSKRSNPRDGFRRVLDRVRVPLGYVNHVWQYFADGRLMNWPAGYHESVEEARRELGIPVFRPEDLVVLRGVSTAMRGDFRHYSEEFVPEISAELVSFAASLQEPAYRELGNRLKVGVTA